MSKIIKVILIILVIISLGILAILFLQDRTKKIEDRKYNEIEKINVNSDVANINIYNTEKDYVRVIVYGTKKDKVTFIEGTKYLDIKKETGNNFCLIDCKNQVDIYVPDNYPNIVITSDVGNISQEDVVINNITVKTNEDNIKLYKTNALYITTEVGNVSINEINATKDSLIKTDVGNIDIDTIINLNIDAKTELGNIVKPVIKEEQKFTLKIETNVGEININHHENKSE